MKVIFFVLSVFVSWVDQEDVANYATSLDESKFLQCDVQPVVYDCRCEVTGTEPFADIIFKACF